MKIKGHKGIAIVSAAVAAATIIFGGTFAWQSISQQYKNEADGYINPGGRLHDDFNGSNKDVYVENFTDPDDFGVPIFARVRMYEYMEIGEDAGNIANPGRVVEIVGKQDADMERVETWQIHIPGNTMEEADKELHKYWKWEMGGQAVYMPTFNKHKDDLEVDVNGSFAGPDGIKGVNPDTNVDDKYEDYVEYKVGDSKTDAAEYADGTTPLEEHTAKETLNATVLTMAQWKAQGSPKGNFWVYDVDGWAYWADAIQPGEATGLLLNGISFAKMPDNGWYYGINVEGQFATVGDWGDKADDSGFYKDGMTEDGLFVLNQAAGRLPSIADIQPKDGYRQYAKAGQNFLLEVNTDIEYPSGSPEESAVKWTSQPETNRLYNNTFAPTKDMVGQTYTFTATSMYDPTKSVNFEVYVYPSDAAGVQVGDDGKEYVDYGDNTFKPINADGTLGAFICAGEDMKMGTTDDRYDVVILDQANPTFGSKFIGPDANEYYYAVGNDGLLGTADDIRVVGAPWPDNITSKLADQVEVTLPESYKGRVTPGSQAQLSAVVKFNGNPVDNQNVKWKVSGNQNANTKIDEFGNLTMGAAETSGTFITVIAESELQPGVTGSLQVEVSNAAYEGLTTMNPGTTTTLRIDNQDWYLLAKDGDRALILSKNVIGAVIPFNRTSKNNQWKDSTMRTHLNTTVLNQLTFLKNRVLDTTITTREQWNVENWYETTDKLFLLSEADVMGTHNKTATSDARDYTYGSSALITNINIKKSSNYYWLRNPISSKVAGVGQTAAAINEGTYASTDSDVQTFSRGVRPAMWIEMP